VLTTNAPIILKMALVCHGEELFKFRSCAQFLRVKINDVSNQYVNDKPSAQGRDSQNFTYFLTDVKNLTKALRKYFYLKNMLFTKKS